MNYFITRTGNPHWESWITIESLPHRTVGRFAPHAWIADHTGVHPDKFEQVVGFASGLAFAGSAVWMRDKRWPSSCADLHFKPFSAQCHRNPMYVAVGFAYATHNLRTLAKMVGKLPFNERHTALRKVGTIVQQDPQWWALYMHSIL